MITQYRSPTVLQLIRITTAFLIGVILVTLFAAQTHAETPGLSITMSPSSTELHAKPGESATGTFTIVNQGTSSYPALLTVAPYHVEGIVYDPQFTLLPGTTDAASWVKLNTTESPTLGSNSTTTITYTLNVPAGTAPGGYYAVIFAETNPTPNDSGITPHNRVGNILYITVDGTIEQKGTLKTPTSDTPGIIFGTNADLGVLVSNNGGLHFVTTANIKVKSLFGRTLFAGEFERYILPQTERLITTSWNNLPPIGIYTLSRDATIAGKVQSLPDRYIVIVQPWVLAFIAVIIILLGALAISSRRKKVSKEKETSDASV